MAVSGVDRLFTNFFLLVSALFSYRRPGTSFGSLSITSFSSFVGTSSMRHLSIHALTRCSRNRVPKTMGVGILSSSFTTVTSSALRGREPITLCYHDKGEDGGTTRVLDGHNCGICRLSGKFGT